MPGPGRYYKDQENGVSTDFLSTWPPVNSYGVNHLTLQECMICRSTAYGSNPGVTDSRGVRELTEWMAIQC